MCLQRNYIIKSYFPSLGEIAITAGLIAAPMFIYRVCVFIFPVLGSRPRAMAPMLFILIGVWMFLFGMTLEPKVSLAAIVTIVTGAAVYHFRLSSTGSST